MSENGNERKESTRISKTVSYPIALYESLKGRYFTSQTPNLIATGQYNAWGALFNPQGSGVNLHINLVTLNYIYGEPLILGFHMNADLPGRPSESAMTAPANTAVRPLPQPEVYLLYASEVTGTPQGGQFSLSRTTYPGALTILQKDGIFIVPPGGNYCAFVQALEEEQDESEFYLAFGWWEEPI